MSKPLTLIRAACLLGLSAVLGACASMQQAPEEVAKQRAQEHLDLIIAQDFEGAFEYLSPGYRSGISVRDYQRKQFNRKAIWKSGKVGKSECSEDVCKIRISVEYVIYGALPGVSGFESYAGFVEDWIRLDGSWYLVPSS